MRWRQHQDETDAGRRTTLIDLDIVTPYFRSREVAQEIQKRGVEVVTPASVSQYLDTPGITPQILGALQTDDRTIILDVGGDEQGARALGQYSGVLRERGYSMYLVVNPFRPFTQDTEGIQDAIADIERTSHLLVTGLVSNPNILSDTTVDDFIKGRRVVEQASHQLSLPIIFTAAERGLIELVTNQLPSNMSILPLERFFVLPWAAAGNHR